MLNLKEVRIKPFIVLVLLFAICLTACGQKANIEKQLVGQWKDLDTNRITLTFNSDGTGSNRDIPFQWAITEDNKLHISDGSFSGTYSIYFEEGSKETFAVRSYLHLINGNGYEVVLGQGGLVAMEPFEPEDESVWFD